jgi:hypothetical protein
VGVGLASDITRLVLLMVVSGYNPFITVTAAGAGGIMSSCQGTILPEYVGGLCYRPRSLMMVAALHVLRVTGAYNL